MTIDGQEVQSQITGDNGSYSVVINDSSFTAGDPDYYSMDVLVTRSDGVTDEATGELQVNDAPLDPDSTLTVQADPANPDQQLTLATFTDEDPQADAAYLSATVDWGDGSGSEPAEVIDNPDGPGFAVVGKHGYEASDTPYYGSVTVTDTNGGSTTNMAFQVDTTPTVHVGVTVSGSASEQDGQDEEYDSNDPLTFTFKRDGDTSQPLDVPIDVSGSDEEGVNYDWESRGPVSGDTVHFAAGQDTVKAIIEPADDGIADWTADVTVSLPDSPAQQGETSETPHIEADPNNARATGYIADSDIGLTLGESVSGGTGSGIGSIHTSYDGKQDLLPMYLDVPGILQTGQKVTLTVNNPNIIVWDTPNPQSTDAPVIGGSAGKSITWEIEPDDIGAGEIPDTVYVGATDSSSAVGDVTFTLQDNDEAAAAPNGAVTNNSDSVRATATWPSTKLVLGFDAFIPATLPGNPITTGWFHEPFPFDGSFDPGDDLYFRGDQRDFGEPGTSRLHTEITIDTALLGHMSSVIASASCDPSYEYDATTTLTEEKTAVPTHEETVTNTTPRESMIKVVDSASYPFSTVAPNIDYTLYFDVEIVSLNKVQITLYGSHDLFPNYEAWVSCASTGGKQNFYQHAATDDGPTLTNLNTGMDIPVPTQISVSVGTPIFPSDIP